MFSRTLGIALLAGGCLTAGAAGAYVATRQSSEATVPVPPAEVAPSAAVSPGAQPVAETEAVVRPPESQPVSKADPASPSKVDAAPPLEAPAPPMLRKETP